MSLTTPEFRALCVARFGEDRWQADLDHWLAARGRPVGRRTIRRWAAGDSAVPGWLSEMLTGGALQVREPPEWIVGETVAPPHPADDSRPQYLVHAVAPRFVARIVEEDEPTAADRDADRLSGVVYAFGGLLLCEWAWLDPPPAGAALDELLQRAGQAVVDWAGED